MNTAEIYALIEELTEKIARLEKRIKALENATKNTQ